MVLQSPSDRRQVLRDARLERPAHFPQHGRVAPAGSQQSVLKQAVLRAGGNVLLPAFLPQSLGGVASAPATCSGKEPGVEEFLVRLRLDPHAREFYAEAHRNLDRLLLPRILEHTGGSQHQAALILGIARQTLRLKLRDLGLSAPRAAEAEGDPG